MHQYAAGLIDGEGYIGIQEAGGSFQVRLKISMSDKGRPALEQMVRLYGGRINESQRRNDRNRDTCTWVTTGEKAASIIRSVERWLLVKSDAASIALQFQLMLETAERLPNGRRKWTSAMRAKAAELRSRIQEANRRGPDPEPDPRISTMEPLAKYRAGSWWDVNDSLFGPEPFSGSLPASGSMINGVIYEAPTTPSSSQSDVLGTPRASAGIKNPLRGAVTDPRGRLEDQIALLRTPCAAEVEGGAISPARAKAEGRTLRLSGQMIDLVAPNQLPPTPRATDGTKGGPNQRGSKGDLMLPSAVHRLTGDPTPQQSDAQKPPWEDVPLPLQS